MPQFRALAFAGLITIALGCSTVHAAEVAVAVASNFTAPMQKIAEQFAHDTGHRAVLSFGATGKFYAQIHHGAPFGVLLAADATTPQKLAQEGLGLPATRMTYAQGQLVLWSQQAGLVDEQGQVLRTGTYPRLAIANPKVAPYGQAAMQVLGHMQLTTQVQPKLVMGENIGQTYQFAASGNATLGFVALSQVMEGGRLREGSAWIVPQALYTPIRQEAIVLRPAAHNEAAHALLDYLKGAKARAIMADYGYRF